MINLKEYQLKMRTALKELIPGNLFQMFNIKQFYWTELKRV